MCIYICIYIYIYLYLYFTSIQFYVTSYRIRKYSEEP